MNSIEITRNKPEFIQNKERNYFLVKFQTRPVKVEMSNHAMHIRYYRQGHETC